MFCCNENSFYKSHLYGIVVLNDSNDLLNSRFTMQLQQSRPSIKQLSEVDVFEHRIFFDKLSHLMNRRFAAT